MVYSTSPASSAPAAGKSTGILRISSHERNDIQRLFKKRAARKTAAPEFRKNSPVPQKQDTAAVACRSRIVRYHQERSAEPFVHIGKAFKHPARRTGIERACRFIRKH